MGLSGPGRRERRSIPGYVLGALFFLNAILLGAFPYLCPLALQSGALGGPGAYAACTLAISRPLFPLNYFLAAVDAALAVALWREGRRARRAALARATLGALAWGVFVLGGLVLRLMFPGGFWLIVFFAAPLVIVLLYSFLKRGPHGEVLWTWFPQNYARFFDPLYLAIFGRSLRIAVLTTLLCFLFGYPLAYYIARRPPRWRNALLLLLMIPFWTNFVVRTYAWKLILADEGFLNHLWTVNLHGALRWLHGLLGMETSPLLQATSQPLHLLYTETAVVIGLVYGWITDMVLPCYAAIERVDFSLVEAAKDLYASDFRAFLRVVFPLSMPGVVAGIILVFIPSLGAYVTPDMLGGAKTMMIGNLIQQQFFSARDWPFGSAISFVLIAIMLVATLFYFRVGGKTL
ncbi:MAG: ABC transporter permease [Chloroflexia bacterium]